MELENIVSGKIWKVTEKQLGVYLRRMCYEHKNKEFGDNLNEPEKYLGQETGVQARSILERNQNRFLG